MLRRLAAFGLLALSLLASACSHYRLGTGVERDFHAIFVSPVESNAVLPQSTAILTTQIREALARDGRVRVVNSPEEAEAILTLKLASLRRESLTQLPTDVGLARKLGLALEATATLRDPKGEKTWFADRRLRVERQVFTEDYNDTAPATLLRPTQQTQAEYAIVPTLGEDLAEKARAAVLDTW